MAEWKDTCILRHWCLSIRLSRPRLTWWLVKDKSQTVEDHRKIVEMNLSICRLGRPCILYILHFRAAIFQLFGETDQSVGLSTIFGILGILPRVEKSCCCFPRGDDLAVVVSLVVHTGLDASFSIPYRLLFATFPHESARLKGQVSYHPSLRSRVRSPSIHIVAANHRF